MTQQAELPKLAEIFTKHKTKWKTVPKPSGKSGIESIQVGDIVVLDNDGTYLVALFRTGIVYANTPDGINSGAFSIVLKDGTISEIDSHFAIFNVANDKIYKAKAKIIRTVELETALKIKPITHFRESQIFNTLADDVKKSDITAALGFKPNCGFDDAKSSGTWGFEVNGVAFVIYDHHKQWVARGPRDVFEIIFPGKVRDY